MVNSVCVCVCVCVSIVNVKKYPYYNAMVCDSLCEYYKGYKFIDVWCVRVCSVYEVKLWDFLKS